MSRREYTIRLVCAYEGCRESTYTTASTRREEAETRATYRKNPYRCYRHSRPDEVLSVDNPVRHTIVVSEGKPYGNFWDRQGLVSGPGFKAICNDFPPGTKLIVTARIELPSEESL